MDDGNWAAGDIQVSALTNAITSQLDWQEDKLDAWISFFLYTPQQQPTAKLSWMEGRQPLYHKLHTDHSVLCDGRCTTGCLVDMSTLNTPWLAIFAHCVDRLFLLEFPPVG